MSRKRSVLAIISARGGGDAPPVIALALALNRRGERVTLVCDEVTRELVSGTGLQTVAIPPGLDEGNFFDKWRHDLQDDIPGPSLMNPLEEWGRISCGYVEDQVRRCMPDIIISSLFCMGLADALAKSFGIPWIFVNPSFYFGDDQARGWQDDWYGPFVQGLAQYCFWPLSQRADYVLHATDPVFDMPPGRLPFGHHYTGFLLWEPEQTLPEVVKQPGDPWALVTVSTVPQRGELELARLAAWSLSEFPIRTLLTLPYEQARADIGPLPHNASVAGFVPHGRFMQHCAIVIGHAGHGLVSKALVKGVPMVLLPWHRDQPGVADRAERLGVAQVVPRAQARPDVVKRAVAAVLDQEQYLLAAQRHARRLVANDPAEMACSLLDQF